MHWYISTAERRLSRCKKWPRCSPQAFSLPIWMRQPCQPSCSCAAGWTGHRQWRCSSPAPASACRRAASPLHSHQTLHPANPSLTVTPNRAHCRAHQPPVALLTYSLSLQGNALAARVFQQETNYNTNALWVYRGGDLAPRLTRVAEVPAARASCPPLPGKSSTLWICRQQNLLEVFPSPTP